MVISSIAFFALAGPVLGTLGVLALPGGQPIEIPVALMAGYLLGILPAAVTGFLNGICVVAARNRNRKLTVPISILMGAAIGLLSTMIVFLAVLDLERRASQIAGLLFIAAIGAIAGAACAGMFNAMVWKWRWSAYRVN